MSDRPPDPFQPPTLASPLVPPPPPVPSAPPVIPPTRPNPFQPPTLASPLVPPTTTTPTPTPTPPSTPPSAPTPPTPGTTPISYRTPPGTPLSQLLGLTTPGIDPGINVAPRAGYNVDSGINRLEALPKYFQDSGNRWGVPPAILKGVSGAETSFGTNIATSSAGAQGLMQFIPETATKYGVDVNNFQSSVDGAAHYLHDLYRQYGNWPQALQAYNGATNDPSMSYARKVLGYAGQNLPQQRYVFASETPGLQYRGPGEWGKPPEGGYQDNTLPTGEDIPAIMQRIRQAYPILSDDSAIGQAAMMRAVDGYVQARQQSQIVAAKLHAEQWQQQMTEFSDKLRIENMDIGSAMAANQDDPAGLSEALSGIVDKYNDRALQQAMAHGPDAVNRLMQARDHLGTDSAKTAAALEKARQDAADRKEVEDTAAAMDRQWLQEQQAAGRQPTSDELKIAHAQNLGRAQQLMDPAKAKAEDPTKEEDRQALNAAVEQDVTDKTAQWRADPANQGKDPPPGLVAQWKQDARRRRESKAGAGTTDETGAEGEGYGATPVPSETTPPATSTVPGAVPPTPSPVPTIPSSQPSPPTPVEPHGAPPTAPPVPAVPGEPQWQSAGRSMFEGVEYKKGDLDPTTMARARGYADRLRSNLNSIVANPNLRGQAVLAAVNALDPAYGGTLQQIATNQADITTMGGRSQTGIQWRETMSTLANRVNPNWNAGQYKLIQEYSKPDGKIALAYSRVGTMANAGRQVLEDLSQIPDNADQLSSALTAWLGGSMVNPAYSTLFNDWFRYMMDANVVSTGQALEGETMTLAHNIPWYSTRERFRQALMHDAANASHRVDYYKTNWQQIGGQGSPVGYIPQDQADLNDLAANARIPGVETHDDVRKFLSQ